jgi:hypothetical protein
MLHRVALVRADVSELHIASTIRVTRIDEVVEARSMLRFLVTPDVVVTSLILVTLLIKAIRSSETSGLTRGTRRNIPEDGIFRL